MVKKIAVRRCPKCGSTLEKSCNNVFNIWGCNNPKCWVFGVRFTGNGAITDIIYASAL
jgi:ribosomal protein L37AE/L43A